MLFALTDTSQHDSPVEAALDLEPRFDISQGKAERFMELQVRVILIATSLETVPFAPIPDRHIWEPFLALVEAIKRENDQDRMTALTQLGKLKPTNKNAEGGQLTAMPSAAWWVARAKKYLEFSVDFPEGTRI